MALTLADIVDVLGGELHGSRQQTVARLATLQSATPADLSFLSHVRYQSQLSQTRAGCVVLSPRVPLAMREALSARIETDDPYLYFARLSQWWRQHQREARDEPLRHPTAHIHPQARVDHSARIGPFCVVERGAVIGADTWLKSHVTVGEDCRVGARCILHAGVSIGADGFGFAPHEGQWVKIEQLGAVRIGDDVEIGANSCVDRGALEDTVIEDGVKIDNLVQIGHNVHIGAHSALAGCAGVAGSARIGRGCTVGGGAVVLGHLSLADGVHISAASVVMRSITQAGMYSGVFPIDDNATWEKNAATLRQLHQLRARIKAIEQFQSSKSPSP
ncbi:MAG: UDP-3-O-[3-hydroxymyristoyl] glucosamine N-acyltransferase [Pseudomonadota bacterium]